MIRTIEPTMHKFDFVIVDKKEYQVIDADTGRVYNPRTLQNEEWDASLRDATFLRSARQMQWWKLNVFMVSCSHGMERPLCASVVAADAATAEEKRDGTVVAQQVLGRWVRICSGCARDMGDVANEDYPLESPMWCIDCHSEQQLVEEPRIAAFLEVGAIGPRFGGSWPL